MPEDVVEALLNDHLSVLHYLIEASEPSYASVLENSTPKVILLAAASYMEKRVTDVLMAFFMETSPGSPHVAEFVRRNAIDRKYHTLFDWSQRNANRFFSSFGKEMKTHVEKALEANEDLAEQIAAFMELGSLRNQLVHDNYATFVLEKTTNEVLLLYRAANRFVDSLPKLLRLDRIDPRVAVSQ